MAKFLVDGYTIDFMRKSEKYISLIGDEHTSSGLKMEVFP